MAIIAFAFKIFGNKTFDPEAYCPFGGLETYCTYLVNGSMACSMTATQIMMGLVLAVGVVLFSRLFCSYICPLGTVVEYLGRLGGAMGLKNQDIKKWSVADIALRAIKYILLFTIFYFTLSSSELFCKNFDPYYAVATGFKGELTMWMACISIAICFICSIFVKMFWCKYICPLGAASNIFKFTLTFIAILAIYAILSFTGIHVSWVIPLAVTCIIGYLNEVIFKSPKFFPLLHITRNDELCTKCGICQKKCPYSIDVQNVKKVKCVDCTLCGECVASCSKNALSINGKRTLNQIPGVIAIVLFAVALYLGTTVELPTIDEKWGNNVTELKELNVDGLRSVKCYGSSKAFSAQLQKINGIYGVATFVKHHKATIYYNPAEISPEKIREAIYTPTHIMIVEPSSQDSIIQVITIHTENMYDKLDPNYLSLQLKNTGKKIFGIETEYNCPLIVRIYAGINEQLDEKLLKSCVEKEFVEIPVPGAESKKIEVNYKFVSMDKQTSTVTRRELLESQLPDFDVMYEGKAVSEENMAIYQIIYPSMYKSRVKGSMPLYSKYLSTVNGIVGFKTVLTDANEYAFQVIYDKSVINEDALWKAVSSSKWVLILDDGSEKELDARISFPDKGVTLSSIN